MASFEKAGNILNRILSDRGYLSVCKENEIIQNWETIVGSDVAAVTRCERVENGVLFVRVRSASWRNEIHFFKRSIIEKINKDFKCKSIKEIVFI